MKHSLYIGIIASLLLIFSVWKISSSNANSLFYVGAFVSIFLFGLILYQVCTLPNTSISRLNVYILKGGVAFGVIGLVILCVLLILNVDFQFNYFITAIPLICILLGSISTLHHLRRK